MPCLPCPTPTPSGWLFKKLFGRLPSENDKAVMTDPDLAQEYRFDVNFIGAANVHYITVCGGEEPAGANDGRLHACMDAGIAGRQSHHLRGQGMLCAL